MLCLDFLATKRPTFNQSEYSSLTLVTCSLLSPRIIAACAEHNVINSKGTLKVAIKAFMVRCSGALLIINSDDAKEMHWTPLL